MPPARNCFSTARALATFSTNLNSQKWQILK
jgi:hypothetical protein